MPVILTLFRQNFLSIVNLIVPEIFFSIPFLRIQVFNSKFKFNSKLQQTVDFCIFIKFTISVNNGKLNIILFQCVIYETVDRYGIFM